MKEIIILCLCLFLTVSCVTKRSLAGSDRRPAQYDQCVNACAEHIFPGPPRWVCNHDLYDQAECSVNELESHIELNCSIEDTILSSGFNWKLWEQPKEEIIKINRTKRLSKGFLRYSSPYGLLNKYDNYKAITMINLLSDSCASNLSCKEKYQCEKRSSYRTAINENIDECRSACK